MIRSITVTNYLGDSIELDLFHPEKSGFIIKSITGLGPSKATINSSENSTTDGSMFNSSKVSSRNIVISLVFMWKDSIEDVRQLSYKYFPVKRKVTLLVKTDNRVSEIEGYVESNDPTIFSKEEGSDISIICPNPFFYSAYEKNTTTFAGIEPAFEFPFSNESLTEPLLEFSEIRNEIDRTIVYSGDYEIGVTLSIRAKGDVTGITIYKIDTRETMSIDTDKILSLTGTKFSDGDEIVICTETGKKSVTLIRKGKSTNILNCIDKNSDWFQLSKGANTFAYTAETGRNNLEVEIQNRVLYEGV